MTVIDPRRALAARVIMLVGVLAAIVAVAVGSGSLLRSTRGDGAAVTDRAPGATAAVTPLAPFLAVDLERDDALAAQLTPPTEGIPK